MRILVSCVVVLGCGTPAPTAEAIKKPTEPVPVSPTPTTPTTPVARRSDPPSVHGMALFGESTAFVSHLPMFHTPHDYQVVLQVSLSPSTRVPAGALFSIEPKPFELARAETPGFEMNVAVYRGHFEREGTKVGEATARVERVIRFSPLVADAPRPAEPSFLLFGTAKEAFLVHVITSKPDYDQIVRVTVPADLDLAKPLEVRVKRSATKELVVGETIEAIAGGRTIAVRIDAQVYLERGDLEM